MPANLQTALKLKSKYPAIWNSNNKEMTILLGFNGEIDMKAHGFESSEDYLTFLTNEWCTDEFRPGNVNHYIEYKRSTSGTKEALALRYIQSIFIQLHGLHSPSCSKELIILKKVFNEPTAIMCKKAIEQFDNYMNSFHEELNHYKLTGEFLAADERVKGVQEQAEAAAESAAESDPYDCIFYCVFFITFITFVRIMYYSHYTVEIL